MIEVYFSVHWFKLPSERNVQFVYMTYLIHSILCVCFNPHFGLLQDEILY